MEPLKNFFDRDLVTSIGGDIRAVHPSFDSAGFVKDCLKGLAPLSLIERGAHIMEKLESHLPKDYNRAIGILLDSLGPELAATEGNGLAPFKYLPHVLFVSTHGLDHFETSMQAQYELTKRFSAEGSIRSFLIKYEERTYARLKQWTKDPNVHVRRLVSEGTRPRLPWAMRLKKYQDDPAPVIKLLELLKDDSDRYVQRSVANNLNDISKDHPDQVVQVCVRWLKGAPPGRKWIVSHALRSLVKRGHRGALSALGFGREPKVRIENVQIKPRRAVIGGRVELGFDLVSSGRSVQSLVVDYAVHFVKADGTTRPKVFKCRKLELKPRERVRLTSRITLKQLTTRKHYPGRHALEALVNGHALPLGTFSVH